VKHGRSHRRRWEEDPGRRIRTRRSPAAAVVAVFAGLGVMLAIGVILMRKELEGSRVEPAAAGTRDRHGAVASESPAGRPPALSEPARAAGREASERALEEPSHLDALLAAAPAKPEERPAAPPALPAPEGASGGATAEPRSPRPARAANAAPSERLFTLELTGAIGGEALDPGDPRTWARLGYFLQQEAGRRHFLANDRGDIPLIVMLGPDGKPVASGPAEQPPAGDASSAGYRLVLNARAYSPGAITFYGEKLASRYLCRIACRIEKRKGAGFEKLDELAVEESLAPATGAEGSEAQYLRLAYDAGLEKLVERLKAHTLFQAPPPPKRRARAGN
jgi:hypothetical protein